MRFCSLNIFSGEELDGDRKKELTKMLRNDSNCVVDAYLNSFKYYNNENCISLNISCDEELDRMFLKPSLDGYPVLHIPFDLDGYFQIKECEKNDFWLCVVRDSIKYVSSIWNWEQAFFDDVYNKCLIRLSNEV